MSEKKSPLKAIKEKCLDCMCGSAYEVNLCTCRDCSLYPFRKGKNPYAKKELTPEQREAIANRLKNSKRNAHKI